jgi:hypothetical protein
MNGTAPEKQLPAGGLCRRINEESLRMQALLKTLDLATR